MIATLGIGGTIAAVGGLASAGTSIYGATQSGGGGGGGGAAGPNDIARSLALEHLYSIPGNSAGLNQLSAQTAYGLGADPEAIAFELLARQIGDTTDGRRSRELQQQIGRLQQYALNPRATPRGIQNLTQHINGIIRDSGGAAFVTIDADGRPRISFEDQSLNAVVDRARAESQLILDRRLTAQGNLSRLAADFPMAGASDINALTKTVQSQLTSDINTQYDRQRENLLQSANTRGYNPGYSLGLLEEQRGRELSRTETTAADRALQMLSGRQNLAINSIGGLNAALSPDMEIAIMNAIRNQQTPTTGQLASAQIGAQASLAANAANNQANSLNNIGGSLNDSAALISYFTRQQAATNTGPGTSGRTQY